MKTKNLTIISAAVCSLLLAAPNARAVTRTWITVSGNWSTASNWSPTGPPQNNDYLVFNSAGISLTNDISSLTVGTILFGHGATVWGSGFTVTSNITVSVPLIANGTVALNTALTLGNSDVTVILGNGLNTHGDLIINNQISGAAPHLRKQGPGTMSLMTDNTYTGVTLLQRGTIYVRSNNGLSSAGVVISDGATLEVDGGFFPTLANTIEMVGAGVGGIGALWVIGGEVSLAVFTGSITLDAATTVNVDLGSELDLNGAICGPGSLTEIGAGTLSLGGSANNCFPGPMVVGQGTLLLNKPIAVSAVPGSLVVGTADGTNSAIARNLNSYQVAGNISVYKCGTLDVNGWTENVDFLELYGGAVQTGAGTLVLKTGGAIDVFSTTGSGSGNWLVPFCIYSTISGHMDVLPGTLPINVNPGLTNMNGPDLEISAQITSATGVANLQKNGAGVLRLTGNNTFQGELQLNGGTIIGASPGAMGASRISVNNGAMFTLDGGVNVSNVTLVLNSSSPVALQSLSGNNIWNGPITLSQPAGMSVTDTNWPLQILGPVSGPGGLTKLGPGTLQIGATYTNWPNSYAGATIVSEGVLELGRISATSVPGDVVIGDDTTANTTATLRTLGGQQLSTAANINVHSSGLFDLYPGIPAPSPTLRTLVGNGLVNLGGGSNGTSSLTVSNDVVCAFGGVISGPGAFNKRGTALMQLTGNNTYAGDTTISTGTLQVDGSQPQSLVQNSGRLQGSGTVGAINMNAGSAVVAPGDSPGVLTCSNFMRGGGNNNGPRGSLELELNGPAAGTGYDQLNVHGTVALTNITLNASLGFPSWLSNTFTIINNDGADPVVGTFNGLAQGATLTIGGQQFQISYTGGDGNDVVLTQISGAPLPTLALATVSPGTLTLSWPTNGPVYRLLFNTNLSSTNWLVVSPAPVIVGGNYVATNATTGAQKFFRLINP